MTKKIIAKTEILQAGKFKCAFCHGSGVQPGSLHNRCSACRGKGKVKFQRPVLQCPACLGKGTAGSSMLFCIRCRGLGIIEKDIEAGKETTQRIEEHPEEITKLGKYLKQLRQEQGLSIRGVARSCDIAPSYLAKIEIGDTFKTIGIENLVKLSKFYGIPVSAILKEAGFIESDESDLPELSPYLRAKYQLSPQAVRDMEMAKEIVDKKYKSLT